MENSHCAQPSVSSLADIKKLAKIKRVFNNYFDQLVDDCFSRIDVEFDMQFGTNRDKYDKSDYISLLYYLRSEKEDIKDQYLSEIRTNFNQFRERCQGRRGKPEQKQINLNAVELVEDDTVAEEYLMNKIVRKSNHRYHDQLLNLNYKFAKLCAEHIIPNHENPVSPVMMVQSLGNVLATLDLDTEQRMALLQVFDNNVLPQISFIYRELGELFEPKTDSALNVVKPAADEEQTIAKPAADEEQTDVEAPPPELEDVYRYQFELLQDRLNNWRVRVAPSAFDIIAKDADATFSYNEVFQALERLQSSITETGLPADWDKQILKQRVIAELIEQQADAKAPIKTLLENHEDVLDLVALVFQSVRQTATLPESVNDLLARTEVPFASIALVHSNFLVDGIHPGRKLLNELYKAGQLLNLDDYSDRLVYDQMERIVDKMNEMQSFRTKFIHKLYRGLSVYMLKRNRRAREMAVRLKDLMRTHEDHGLDNTRVEQAIENSLKGKEVPDNISLFIDQVWRKVLMLAISKIKRYPDFWTQSVSTMNDLVHSVIAPENEAQRKDLLAMLPGMINALKSGLIKISYSKPDQSRFFKELAVCHVILMNKDVINKTNSSISEQTDAEVATASKPIQSRYRTQAFATELEKWYLFDQGPHPKWGRLVWKSKKTEKFLFVGKNGSKVAELFVDDLAELYSQKQISKVSVDKSEIVEKTFDDVLGGKR